MTEPTPSKEAILIAMRAKGINFFAISADEAAREIDALTEQRVAAAFVKCLRATMPRDGEAWSRDALEAAKEIRNRMAESDDCPAPDGAAPIPTYGLDAVGSGPSLAQHRCSTPSQEHAGSVSGEKLWLWKNGDHYLAFAHEYPTYGGGDPMVLGEPAGYAMLMQSAPRRADPPNVTGDPGSASNTDAAQESFQCPSCHWHHGHDPAEWFTEEAKLRGFLELVNRERVPFVVNEEVAESSPTQTVAAPGPTAGDVERTAQAMLDHIGNGDKLNMADQCRRIVTVQLSSADLIGMAKVGINNTSASADPETDDIAQAVFKRGDEARAAHSAATKPTDLVENESNNAKS